MIKPSSPKQLAIDILSRSICSVKVGAAVEDAAGHIISWGWNSVGKGFGEHAEASAIRRANPNRLWYGTIYIASVRRKHGKPVMSKPCEACEKLIKKWHLDVVYRDGNGDWNHE